jgi:hypothetical protein
MRYEITTLTLRLGGVAAAMAGIEAHMRAPEALGTFLGCWTSEVGALNRMILLRGYADDAEMRRERARLSAQTNPFGAGEAILDMDVEAYAPFPWCPPPVPGAHGRVWEMRTYRLKPGGLEPTIAAWEKAMPARGLVSPLALVLYALDGPSRFTHFWPYASFDDRFDKRARAVSEGVWPPVGGPQ